MRIELILITIVLVSAVFLLIIPMFEDGAGLLPDWMAGNENFMFVLFFVIVVICMFIFVNQL